MHVQGARKAAGGDTAVSVDVEVPVKLRGRAGRRTAVLTLKISTHFNSVHCQPPGLLGVGQCPGAMHAEHASAAAVVSQPELLLPTEAVHGEGADSAETRSFLVPVQASGRQGSLHGQPLLVR